QKEHAEEVTTSATGSEAYREKSTEELKNMLQTALDEEQYEMASKIRDELNQRKKS
ncbi:MAG: UvrB/UvrC motif-containing protein, partial [Bacteroidia bacterium]